MNQLSRHEVAKRMGRRVSRGEFERMFTRYVDRVYVGRRGPRVIRELDSQCPKAKRKRA